MPDLCAMADLARWDALEKRYRAAPHGRRRARYAVLRAWVTAMLREGR